MHSQPYENVCNTGKVPTTGYGKWLPGGSTYMIEKRARHLLAYIFSMWFITAEGRGTNTRTGRGEKQKNKTASSR